MSEYSRIRAEAPESPDANPYDTLLTRFEASTWRKELRRYDLGTSEGQTAAKRFLRQIVYRERRRAQALIASLPFNPDEP